MSYAIAAVAASGVVGGIVGGIASSGDRKRAAQAAAQAYQEALSLGLPPDNAKAIVYREFDKAGLLTPEMEQTVDMGISQVEQIKEDPALRDAQTNALQILQQTGQTGFGAQDRSALNKIHDEIARNTEGKRQQILQQMQQRGMGGSGAELAAQLSAAQGGSNQASASGDQVAADAATRALEAMSRAGALSGDVRSQDFNVANTKASAADQFKRFNVENQMNVNSRNVASRNQSAAANLDNSQRIKDANVGLYNNEQQRQRDAAEQYWQDMAQRTQMRVNARLGQANQFQQSANQTANQWSQIGTGVGQGVGAYASYNASKPPASGVKAIHPEDQAMIGTDRDKFYMNQGKN